MLRTQNPRMRFRRDLRAHIPIRLRISRYVVLPLVCFSLARAKYTFARTGWAAPVIFREGGEDASSLWGYGVWTAEEP